jgi:hypothetical protein
MTRRLLSTCNIPNGWFLIALDRNTTRGLAPTVERVSALSFFILVTAFGLLFFPLSVINSLHYEKTNLYEFCRDIPVR